MTKYEVSSSSHEVCFASQAMFYSLLSSVTNWVTCKRRRSGTILQFSLIYMWLPLPWSFSPYHPDQQIAETVHEWVLPHGELGILSNSARLGQASATGLLALLAHAQRPGKWGSAWFQLSAVFFFFALFKLEMLLI